MKYRANARPRTVQQITSYLRSNGVDAEVIACAGYFRFRGGAPPGGWVLPNLTGFSLDGMSFGDWLRAYRDMYAAHEAYHRDKFRRRGDGFAMLVTKWSARLLEHQRSTAKGRAELREIGRRLSRFESSAAARCGWCRTPGTCRASRGGRAIPAQTREGESRHPRFYTL